MLDDFLKYINTELSVQKDDKILLTVSGGIDSMVMSDLFFRAGYITGIAHCNFGLRGKDSDLDEDLVRKMALSKEIPFFCVKFKTKEFAAQKRISIQMAARELRYEWFEKIRQENKYDYIAVAHNLNDNIETLLINHVRGTGIAGLTGKNPSENRIIRPLLFAERQTIDDYSKEITIAYREDITNRETKYVRNKIRHLVIPVLKEINPSVEKTLNETASRLWKTHEIVSAYIETIKKELFDISDDNIIADIKMLNQYITNETILYELFRPFGLTGSNMNDLINIISGESGKQLYTRTHRLVNNRGTIIITESKSHTDARYTINSIADFKTIPFVISARIENIKSGFSISRDPCTAFIDMNMVSYPIVIRSWQPGDFFYPLGMINKKKLSDYLTDRKLSRPEKEKTMVLELEGKIAWVIGNRIDNRFRITDTTREALIIETKG